ncbi:NAD(P)/FAD-dependent oxidoreductase [Aurantiacibacter aquimixticola]|uniref:FAD-binding protein n=1 Tax=Aurantiacibacter aquimixticola TaxID=1958945 RepID=A0A419RR75_9SPHN|nr:FAD-dependent oxidoreductase [Aurantiacibacter aquimixticola]RJY08288.1 FAD-binding protein [Aurantiacibacter aquimixticola]
MKIAIIGAGMAGLSCGARLKSAGHDVKLFDKGRGPGGRMATRRAEVDGKILHFDHGAQYLTVSDDRFGEQVARWEADGVVAKWPAAKDGAWVGTPGMNAPIKAMASEQHVHFATRIETITADGEGWRVGDDNFDAVVVATPAEQVPALLADHAPDFAELAERTVSDPCWTVMAAFDGQLDAPDTLRHAGSIGWAARNSAKPQRAGNECWVIQGSPEWSREYLEEEADGVATLLLDAFREQVGGAVPLARHVSAHRWRYSMSGNAGEGALWNSASGIGVCGDWLLGPRVECAFLSGWELADIIGG